MNHRVLNLNLFSFFLRVLEGGVQEFYGTGEGVVVVGLRAGVGHFGGVVFLEDDAVFFC